jgi:hypothetical protein
MQKSENQKARFNLMGLAKPAKSHRLMGTGSGMAPNPAWGYVFGHFWN